MSGFEIFLIVMLCAIPVIAFLFVLPKKQKKETKQIAQTKTYEEMKKEEKQNEEIQKEEPKEKAVYKPKVQDEPDISTKDFENYIDWKRKHVTKPNRIELPTDFDGKTYPYIPNRKRKAEEKPKNVAEEIQNLSPELKALIIAGVLDPKNFDKL